MEVDGFDINIFDEKEMTKASVWQRYRICLLVWNYLRIWILTSAGKARPDSDFYRFDDPRRHRAGRMGAIFHQLPGRFAGSRGGRRSLDRDLQPEDAQPVFGWLHIHW